jgi:hypothetical protein
MLDIRRCGKFRAHLTSMVYPLHKVKIWKAGLFLHHYYAFAWVAESQMLVL